MNQDSTEAPVDERAVPGESIARRLFSRGATRASVGPRAEFYHRLGVADPYSVTESDEAVDEGPFTFLSSSAYFRDLRRSRLGLLSRISGGARKSGFAGSRLRRVGPAAAMVRPSALARLGLGEDDFTVLVDPLLAGEEEEEDPFSYRIIPRQPKAAIVTPRTRERVVFRPVEQAMAREGGEADDELTRVLQRVLSGFRGRERRELQAILEEVATQPAARRMAVAKQALRRLHGPARAMAQTETAEVFEAEGQRPVQVAAGRSATAPTKKGLRRVLGASPAVLMLEAPSEAVEEEADVTPRVVRRVQPPVAARRAPATRRSSPREAARTQQTSGRAGPSSSVEAPAPTSAARVASRRPMERMAARAQHAAATPDYVEGIASRPAGVTRARVGALRREEAGQPQFGDRAPMARAATGYVRRRRPQAPDVVLVAGEAEVDEQLLGDEQPMVARRVVRERAVPVAAASQRAVERAEAVAPAAVPRRSATPAGRAARVEARSQAPSEQPVASRSTPSRRRLASSPTSYVARSAALAAEDARISRAATGRVPRLRRRALALGGRALPAVDGASVATTTETATVRAARRGATSTTKTAARRRSVLPPLATSYLAMEVDDALAEAAPVSRPTARRASVAGAAPTPPSLRSERAETVLAEVPQRGSSRSIGEWAEEVGGEDTRVARETATARRLVARSVASEMAEEAPIVRAARRSAAGALPEARRGRTVLPLVATSYLAHELDEEPEGPELSATHTPRRRPAPAAAAEPVAQAGRAAVQVAQGTARRLAQRLAEDEAPVVRAARRRVAPGRVAAGRAVLAAAPTAYLDATTDEVSQALPVAVVDAQRRAPRPTQRAAQRDQPVVATDRSGRVALAASPVAYAALEGAERGPLSASPVAVGRRATAPSTLERLFPDSADEMGVGPAVAGPRASRRRFDAPEQVLAEPQGADDELAEGDLDTAGPATARLQARASESVRGARSVQERGPQGRGAHDAGQDGASSPTDRLQARAEQGRGVVAPSVASSGGPAVARARRAGRRSPLADAVLPGLTAATVGEQPTSTASNQGAIRRPSARVAERLSGTRRGRSSAAVVAHRVARPQRAGRGLDLAVGAMAAAGLRTRHEPMRGSVAPRPVSRFDWSAVVDEVVATYRGQQAERAGAPVARAAVLRGEELQLAMPSELADDSVAGDARRPLALGEVARRTREAVHALGRVERSVLTFDASRRTFGDVAGREHTVVARVAQDAQGRVRRVRATRLATGEQVLLAPDAVEGIEALAQPSSARPSQAAWVEERATVGRAMGREPGVAPVREAPGARLVERAAAPEGRIARRRPQVAPAGVLAAPSADEAAPPSSTSRVSSGSRSARRPVALGPVTLAGAALPSVVPEDAELGSTVGRRSPVVPMAARQLAALDEVEAQDDGLHAGRRSLRGSMASLGDAQRAPQSFAARAAARGARRRRARGRAIETAPGTEQTLAQPWSPEEAAMEGQGQASASQPGWVRRANEGTSVPVRPEVPEAFLRPRLRTSGGLLTALARAGDAEEVVRVILERSHDLGDASLLPVAAQRLMHRVAGEAHQVAAAARGDRLTRGPAGSPRMVETVKNNILQPVTVAAPGARSTATTRQGVGASKVMKLANKLMKLIHLAEADGRGDAHKHVRMSEDTAESRAEGGAGGSSGDQFDEKTMNIKALRQDVLDAVLKALEDMRWRREDPDGPSIWC